MTRTDDTRFYEAEKIAVKKVMWNLTETLLLLHLYPLNIPCKTRTRMNQCHFTFERFQELYNGKVNIREKSIRQFRAKVKHLEDHIGIYNRDIDE